MADIEQIIRQMSNENTARTFKFNATEAEKERDWSMAMSNSSHQREVNDLKRAGLNPVLSANGGASAYSASSASASADNSAPALIASIYQTKLNNENSAKIAAAQRAQDFKIAQMNNKNALQLAKINQAISKYASDKASSASKYVSDQNYSASVYGTNVSSATSSANSRRQYGSTDAGMIDSLGLGKKGTKIAKGAYVGTRAFGNLVGTVIKALKKKK